MPWNSSRLGVANWETRQCNGSENIPGTLPLCTGDKRPTALILGLQCLSYAQYPLLCTGANQSCRSVERFARGVAVIGLLMRGSALSLLETYPRTLGWRIRSQTRRMFG